MTRRRASFRPACQAAPPLGSVQVERLSPAQRSTPRDYRRARKDRKAQAHLPQGTLGTIAGGKDIADPAAVIARLDSTRAKYADMVLVHGGGSGVEKIAVRWAERNGVHQIVCKPDWKRHGRAAPFRRNDELLDLLPKGVIAFTGNGIIDNLDDKARHLGIPVMKAA